LAGLLNAGTAFRSRLYDYENDDIFTNLRRHEVMLADRVRLSSYRDAIARAVGPSDHVLDLGTGSGILALMAARNGAASVTAIDHSDFIETARQIARINNEVKVDFIQINSRRFEPARRFDLLIHEQMGSDLFDENMVTNILDLKRRVLNPGGRVLPGKFEIFIEPLALKDDYQVPFIWKNDLWGVDFSFMESAEALDRYRPADYLSRMAPDLAVAMHSLPFEPAPLFAFDLNSMNGEEDIPRKFEMKRVCRADGLIDGFCFYFKVVFDDHVSFDTAPSSRHTHWQNRLFRTARTRLRAGSTLAYTVSMGSLMDASTWSVSIA